jgi:hypothetical protein
MKGRRFDRILIVTIAHTLKIFLRIMTQNTVQVESHSATTF